MITETTIRNLAVALTRGVNAETVRRMAEAGVSAEEFLTLPDKELGSRLGMVRGRTYPYADRREALRQAESQLPYLEKGSIRVYSLLEPETYPRRLADCADAPVALFQCGDANLDRRNVVDIVGTRRPTAYGLGFTRELMQELKRAVPDLLIVSGLAYGIDAAAHTQALEEGIPTAGVMAHGLHMIYPAAHRGLAERMIRSGGAIVSEYPFGAKPYRQSFLERNRVIAGLSDVTIVVESAIKGGARSTASDAASYGRETFALPGRVGDPASAGCNRLIADGAAMMITATSDILRALSLDISPTEAAMIQPSLFPAPQPEGKQKLIADYLKERGMAVDADRIGSSLGIPAAELLSLLGEMEMEGMIDRLPGNRFVTAPF